MKSSADIDNNYCHYVILNYLYHCVAVVFEVGTGYVRTYHDIRGRLLIPFVFDDIIAEFDGSCCYEVLDQHYPGLSSKRGLVLVHCFGHTDSDLILHIPFVHLA
jgi:hypothetical protein